MKTTPSLRAIAAAVCVLAMPLSVQAQASLPASAAATAAKPAAAALKRYELQTNIVDGKMVFIDAKGQVKIKFPRAGLFWLNADATDKKTSIAKATERRLGYIATLEVLP